MNPVSKVFNDKDWRKFALNAYDKQQKKVVPVKMSAALVRKMDEVALVLGISRSELVRLACAAAVVGLTQDMVDEARMHIADRMRRGITSLRSQT